MYNVERRVSPSFPNGSQSHTDFIDVDGSVSKKREKCVGFKLFQSFYRKLFKHMYNYYEQNAGKITKLRELIVNK